MTKYNYFLSIVFLVTGLCFAGHTLVGASVWAGEEDRPIHISDRIKIERPEMPPEMPPEVAPEELPEYVVDIDDLVDEELLIEDFPELAVEDRYYDEEGRVDPFEPFLRRPEPDVPDEDVEAPIRRIPRTPLERIALGQLKLTAVILSEPDRRLAMVEDARGRGYVIREGTYIGEDGGRVSRILPRMVVVEEPHRDVFGQTTIREIELQIQRAGE